MSKISVVSFIYEEEGNIDEWLSQLKPYAHEIILFDLESKDRTYELCKKYTDKVYKRPFQLCGDIYKIELVSLTTGNWLFWLYPDERLSKSVLTNLDKLTEKANFDAFAFMRHEYMDGVRISYNTDKGKVSFGTVENPNYQNRLHRKCEKIFYTPFVHAELHGVYKTCGMPPEFFMEHHKTSKGQEYDNIRLYIYYNYLTWTYRNTPLEPYRTFVNSYQTIIQESVKKNLSGERLIHLSEEFWWDWQKYAVLPRITLEEFKGIVGVSYEEFVNRRENTDYTKMEFVIPKDTVDEILRERK